MVLCPHSVLNWLDQYFPNCYNIHINSKQEPQMQVRELIELLSQFDPESPVLSSQAGGEYESDLSGLEVEVCDGVVWLRD